MKTQLPDNNLFQAGPTSVVVMVTAADIDGRVNIITLGITPQDAVVLTWALNSGVNINLALRSARDVPQVPTTSVTLQYMIETYNITIPPKLPQSLEPSIRTVGLGGQLPTVTPAPES